MDMMNGVSKGIDQVEGIMSYSNAPLIPVIKIVGNYCNLKCDYCFYHARDQSNKTIMNKDLLEKFIKEYLTSFKGSLRFTWHGGEPLLAGLDYFKHIIELERHYQREDQSILNTVQTNGTLINDDWASFFKSNDFRVGVSLDGVKECHNRFRKNLAGKGSFSQTVQGIMILKKYEVPVGILQTITKSNIYDVNKNINFFVNDLEIDNIGFCHYNPVDEFNDNMIDQVTTNEELSVFYEDIIKLWTSFGDPGLKIRQIDDYFAGVVGKKATLCDFSGSCKGFFCLDYDGKIYPCDNLSSNESYILGDLSRQSLLEILMGSKRDEFVKNISNLPYTCLSCEWLNACNNGCPAFRTKDGKYFYCETRKTIFKNITQMINKIDIIKKLLEKDRYL